MNASKKLFGSLAALVIAIAVATSSTYAWFTSNSKVTVESFDLSVKTGTNDLFVAVKKGETAPVDADFVTDITKAMLDFDSQFIVLDALTMAKPAEGEAGKLTAEGTADEVTYDAAATAESPNSFYEFTLVFRSATAGWVYLGDESKVNPVEKEGVTLLPVRAWDAIADGAYGNTGAIEKGAALNARAANAVRVGFIAGTDTKVWGPNEAADAANTGAIGKGFWKDNIANDYRNNLMGTSTTVPDTVFTPNLVKGSSQYTTNSVVELKKAADADEFYQAEVTFKIWIEGWDGDCFNSIYRDTFRVDLSFFAGGVPTEPTPAP